MLAGEMFPVPGGSAFLFSGGKLALYFLVGNMGDMGVMLFTGIDQVSEMLARTIQDRLSFPSQAREILFPKLLPTINQLPS